MGARAHQPDVSSTMLSQLEDGRWVVQVRASLTAFEFEVHKRFGTDSYATADGFKSLLLEHLREHIAISFGVEGKVELLNGQVRLGHETNVVFEVVGIPEDFREVSVQNSSFKDIFGNKGVLLILRDGIPPQRFLLTNSNGHTVHLAATNGYLAERTVSDHLSTSN